MIKKHTPLRDVLKVANQRSHKGCRKCVQSCTLTSGIFLDDDLKRFAKEMGISKQEAKKRYMDRKELFNTKLHRAKQIKGKYPQGRCIFLKNNLCSIHKFKPVYCQVGTCEPEGEHTMTWYTLKFLVNPKDPESIRQWDSYLRFNSTIDGGELKNLIKDKKKLKRILNYEVLK
ncbi:YkgJ family cysteine cluster protein [Candidatus Woesearchaeota archaeon]|nr:YkgJ family cysteine cluster protein [Candidatus Woesearchaeota archaeon]